jgi:hypothetical protein
VPRFPNAVDVAKRLRDKCRRLVNRDMKLAYRRDADPCKSQICDLRRFHAVFLQHRRIGPEEFHPEPLTDPPTYRIPLAGPQNGRRTRPGRRDLASLIRNRHCRPRRTFLHHALDRRRDTRPISDFSYVELRRYILPYKCSPHLTMTG